MSINRKRLGALLCVVAVGIAVASTAGAARQGDAGGDGSLRHDRRHVPAQRPGVALRDDRRMRSRRTTAGSTPTAASTAAQINDIVRDDQYDPTKTVPDVKKLVEKDQVFAIVGSLGTAPGLATWNYLNQKKVPQVLLATGDAYWGTCTATVRSSQAVLHEAQAVDDGLAAGLPGRGEALREVHPRAQVQAAKIGDPVPERRLRQELPRRVHGRASAAIRATIVDQESYNVTDSAV